MGEQLLGRRRLKLQARLEAPEEFAAAEPEKSELERLCRENAQLRMDNKFLGKAPAFFGSKQQDRNASS
ncbi:hypothetical protein ARTSIC4J27_4143 [Pseudarthrobacter siccitolerans]|uniref:Transposase n=1 Tax=Pseudarthrobacter siccitolerans TaxID=861266 RepID=A0A024H8S8_9MICC|nr:hypothetical protein [Pseudarthrobacter siccitolerans]CCQ48146.1 hypothetical protein ARTSIC4J27_4143 [Pseudarthrobacter siccitolerans]